ncbi:MAG: ABC transporter permease subunit [Candidatus Altiarchaeota archaeon]|nr:ABC transporter permease subunit [Candidatus Altiarchaeota archaeon]
MSGYNKIINRKNLVAISPIILAIVLSMLGFNLVDSLPHLPVEDVGEGLISWMDDRLEVVFDLLTLIIETLLGLVSSMLIGLPAVVVIAAFISLGYVLSGWRLSAFILTGYLFIAMMGYWEDAMMTLSLVVAATVVSLIAGIPLGVLKTHSQMIEVALDPVLDFMQTMPMFVYLIPSVFFFGIGDVPGIISTFIFATPPAVRLTALGIKQIPAEILEAGKAFGASRLQSLFKIELPLAMPSIMLGVNQTIMLSLSMVVVGSMIGAAGLGEVVLRGITRLQVGEGIAAGLGIVLIAMILDKITKSVVSNNGATQQV